MDFHGFAPVLRAGSTPGVLSSPEQVWRFLPKWLVRTRIQAWFLDVVWAILQFAAAGRGRSCSSMCSPASGHVPASRALSLKPVDVPQGPDVTSSASAGTPGLLDTMQDTLSRAPLLPFCMGQSCLQLPHRGLQGIKHECSVSAHQECYLEGLDQSLEEGGGSAWTWVSGSPFTALLVVEIGAQPGTKQELEVLVTSDFTLEGAFCCGPKGAHDNWFDF